MYQKLARSERNVLGYRIEGKITTDEVREIHGEIRQTLRDHPAVRLLLEIGELSLPEPGAIVEDLKLAPEYLRRMERVAIVGRRGWPEWLGRATGWLTHAEGRFFEDARLDEAWIWIFDGATAA